MSFWTKIQSSSGIVSAVGAGSLCERLHAIQCIERGFRGASFCVHAAASGTCGVPCLQNTGILMQAANNAAAVSRLH